LQAEHFVVLWSKGAAACAFVHQGGRVRGGLHDDWSQESADRSTSSEFENPLLQLEHARNELLAKFQAVLPMRQIGTSVETVGGEEPEIDPVLSVIAEQSPLNGVSRVAAFEHCTRGIVILTAPVDRIKIDHIAESKKFVVVALDQAVTRTIFHLPNLLRAIDFETSFFTNEEVTIAADTLEKEANARAAGRGVVKEEAPKPRVKRSSKGAGKWIAIAIAAAILVALIAFLTSNTEDPPSVGPGPDTTKPVVKPASQSSILLVLPTETQAFISETKFNTSAELRQAIGAGQGKRMFPQKEQVITLDSSVFAAGVYGYFKVEGEGEWRTGKLLQTLRAQDTVIIENFLPPLP
ncbi:MAG TPA: hypothetical protein VFH43_08415, partial [Candidatus Kapabacteria bacterium]|nr:hypothetical protein [Candidatus Kapabacteria bacterium]